MGEPPTKRRRQNLSEEELVAMVSKAWDRLDTLFQRVPDLRAAEMKEAAWQQVVEAVNSVANKGLGIGEVWREFMALKEQVHRKEIHNRRHWKKMDTALMNGKKCKSQELKLTTAEQKMDSLMSFTYDEGLGGSFDRGGLPPHTSKYRHRLESFINEEETNTGQDESSTKPTSSTHTSVGNSASLAPPAEVYIMEGKNVHDTGEQDEKEHMADTEAVYVKLEEDEVLVKEEIDVSEEDTLEVYPSTEEHTQNDTHTHSAHNPQHNDAHTHNTHNPLHVNNEPSKSLQDLENKEPSKNPHDLGNNEPGKNTQDLGNNEPGKNPQDLGNGRETNSRDNSPPGEEDQPNQRNEIMEELKEMKCFMREMSDSLKGIRRATADIAASLREIAAARNGFRR